MPTITPDGEQNTVAATVIDSGPGPLDVLEARCVLEERAALDAADRAVAELVMFIGGSPQPRPAAVAGMARRVAEDIDHALTVARAVARLAGRDW